MEYYQLPRDKRWLEDGDSPYSIGGRSTDVDQIAYSLIYSVKQLFPMNAIPKEIILELNELKEVLKDSEARITHVINTISEFMK